ncbi:unnamed protein product [Ectocarpus sp. 4 AP-2014]
MFAAQDWDMLSKGMIGVLEQEAKERASNRDAIAALRRRSIKKSTGKNNEAATCPAPSKGAAKPTQHAPRGATGVAQTADVSENLTTERSERRVRRLRSLPGSAPSRPGPGPSDSLLPRRRKSSGVGASPSVGSSGATVEYNTISRNNPPPSSPAASVNGGGDQEQTGAGGVPAFWPSSGEGVGERRREGRRGRGVPPDVVMTDATPAKLSCGYCRKLFRVQILDRHEERCPSRNLDLFATPCVACGLQGPRCACWALRNGLLKEARIEPDKPLFALFKNSRGGRTPEHQQPVPADGSCTKRASGFLGGWKAGEGIRRPVPLMEDDNVCGPDGDSDFQGGKNNAKNVEESPEERWMRERDDWLFGRTVTENTGGLPPMPPLCRASACGAGSEEDSSREREKENDGGVGRHGSDNLSAGMSDEVFLLQERMQMQSHLEKVRDAAKVRRYTEKWFRFSSDPPDTIRHGDVPWLPKLSALGKWGASLGRGVFLGGGSSRAGAKGLLQDERFETLGVNEGDSSDIKKAALRAASLRWHPDKFMSKYGPRIASEDRANIEKDVQATMQRITKLRERLHNQQGNEVLHNKLH